MKELGSLQSLKAKLARYQKDLIEQQVPLSELEIQRIELEAQNKELMRAQQAIEVSRDRYAELYDFGPMAYMGLDPSGVIINMNLRASELLGLERLRVIGRPFAHFVASSDRKLYWQHLMRCRNERVTTVTDLTLAPWKLPTVPVQLVSVASDLEGGATVFLTAVVEMREREKAEHERELLIREQARREQAEQANQAKDEFLATLSHELRTPLNTVQGWVHLLRTGTLSESKAHRAYEVIERNVQSQVQLISDLLDLSRIARGDLSLEMSSTRLAPIVETAIEGILPIASGKGIEVLKFLDPATGPVLGDPGRLHQMVANVLVNAVKFTPQGGRIEVRLDRIPASVPLGVNGQGPGRSGPLVGCARITVTDNGIGIKHEHLHRIFERFHQADSSSTTRQTGLGLGLAIVRYLAERHGGVVGAHSAGQGQGATITIEIPLLEGYEHVSLGGLGSAAHSGKPRHAPLLQGLTVLVVDDDPDTREMALNVLEPYGASVKTAASAGEAFETLKVEKPDVLVSDITMPVEDGYSLIGRVRRLEPEAGARTPAIALTAMGRADDKQRALAAGFDLYLAKPVDPLKLAEIIAVAAGRN